MISKVAATAVSVLMGCTGTFADGAPTPTSEPIDVVVPSETCEVIEVGASPLRRLTRDEYSNVVRDILGVESQTAFAALGEDGSVGSFDFNHESITELTVDQYSSAAGHIVSALGDDVLNLVTCDRSALGREQCVRQVTETLGRRLFRRPLTTPQVDAFVELSAPESNYRAAVAIVTEAMLQSPQFIYHLTLSATSQREGFVALDGYDIAARLAFFLWGTAPDVALLDAAQAGELGTAGGVRSKAQDMLRDARAQDTVWRFYSQFLHLRDLPQMDKDYDEFTPERRASMLEGTRRFVDWVHFGDVPGNRFEALLTSPVAFVDDELAAHYNIAAPSEPFGAVELDSSRWAGILTHPSVLSVHGKAGQSAPIQRGTLVREGLFCQTLPSPPSTVMVDDPIPDPNTPRRQQFQEHSDNTSCRGCHRLIDPIGFGFEHYDGMGRYRSEDGGEPVDATGEVIGSGDLDGDGVGDADGTYVGAPELAHRVAGAEQTMACLAQQWFRFAHGRRETRRDGCAIRAAVDALSQSNGDLEQMILELAAGETLRHIDLTEEAP